MNFTIGFLLAVLFILLRMVYRHKIVFAEYNFDTEVMNVKRRDGKYYSYLGDCTIWRSLPNLKRCDTFTESELADILEYIKYYKKPYVK